MSTAGLITLGLAFGLWTLLQLKTSRPDGTLVSPLHPYRRLMPYVMRSRNESVVYFDAYIDAQPLTDYLAEAGPAFGADVTQCSVAAMAVTMMENPTVNRFIVGRRIYDRNHIAITFSMKRKERDPNAKLAVVKTRVEPSEDFRTLCHRINAQITVERSDTKTYADKEYGLLHRIPRPILRLGIAALRTLDYYNLLPRSFIENDAMYTTCVIANLGTVGMGAGYHHAYEWGTCGVFMMVGAIEDRPVVRDGKVTIEKTLHARYTYDERINDGLTAGYAIETVKRVLENPREHFGCLREDGSDARALGAGAESGTPSKRLAA